MKRITAEWVAKAEKDFSSLKLESSVRRNANFDLICFLAQQCVEKYLKAKLSEEGIPFRKVHDLYELLEQATQVEPQWAKHIELSLFLTQYAVHVRYPGYSAAPQDAEKALVCCKDFRQAARKSLGLSAKRKRKS